MSRNCKSSWIWLDMFCLNHNFHAYVVLLSRTRLLKIFSTPFIHQSQLQNAVVVKVGVGLPSAIATHSLRPRRRRREKKKKRFLPSRAWRSLSTLPPTRTRSRPWSRSWRRWRSSWATPAPPPWWTSSQPPWWGLRSPFSLRPTAVWCLVGAKTLTAP